MTRKFKTLFSFNFTHNFYTDRVSDDFSLIPTPDCVKIMMNHGLFLKKKGNKYVVVFQENENGGVIKKIEQPIKLRFLLEFNNQSLKKTTDFTLPIGSHPNLIGRRMVYVNNLNQAGTVYNEDITPCGEMSISYEGEVSWKDFVAVVPTIFPVAIDSNAASSYVVKKLNAGDGFQTVLSETIPEQHSTYKIDLSKHDDSLYKLTLNGQQKNIYRSDEVFRAAPFGLVEIFLAPDTNYSQETLYFIEFRRHAIIN